MSKQQLVGELMSKQPEIKVSFTLAELKLIKFMINHRHDADFSKLYQESINTFQDTHVGIKILDAIAELESRERR